MFKLDLEKAEEPEIKLPTFAVSQKKQENSRKASASLTTLKPLTVWITTNWKILKRNETTRPLYLLPDKTCMQVKKWQFESDMEKQIGTKLGKEYVKAVYCHPAYLTSMQSTSCEMSGWMKHSLESRLPGEISTTSDMQMIPPLWQSEEELKSLLIKVKEESETVGLKLNTQKTKITASGPITS